MNHEWTVAELVAVNSHELTASLLLSARAQLVEERAVWAAERAKIAARLEEATMVGERVLRAAKAGRRVVRVSEVVGGE